MPSKPGASLPSPVHPPSNPLRAARPAIDDILEAVPVRVAGIAARQATLFRIALAALSLAAAAATLTLPGVVLMLTVAMLCAAALERPVEALRRRGVRRSWGGALAVFIVTLAIAAVVAVLAPLLTEQLGGLIEQAPGLLDSLSQRLRDIAAQWGFSGMRADAGGSLGSMLQRGAAPAAAILGQSLNALLLLVLVPFVTYFMIASAPQTKRFLRKLPPPSQRRAWFVVAARLRRRLGSYLRGLVSIALVQSVLMAVMLGLIGLNFGILIGIAAGLSSIVPVIGNLSTFAIAMVVAVVQFDSLWPILLVAGAFGIAQVLETAVLQPMLMGDAIAVPPLVMIVALIVGGSLFGAVGAIVAVPAAAAGGVILEALIRPPLQTRDRH